MNRAGNVRDAIVPDDIVFKPGATFSKGWRIENVGICTWGERLTWPLATSGAEATKKMCCSWMKSARSSGIELNIFAIRQVSIQYKLGLLFCDQQMIYTVNQIKAYVTIRLV